jgi:hypothetical protein
MELLERLVGCIVFSALLAALGRGWRALQRAQRLSLEEGGYSRLAQRV